MALTEKVTYTGDTTQLEAAIQRGTRAHKQFTAMVRDSERAASQRAGAGAFVRGGFMQDVRTGGRLVSGLAAGFGVVTGVNRVAGMANEMSENLIRRRSDAFSSGFMPGSTSRGYADQAAAITPNPTRVASFSQILETSFLGYKKLGAAVFGSAEDLENARQDIRNFGDALSDTARLAQGDPETLRHIATKEAELRAAALEKAFRVSRPLFGAGSGYSHDEIREWQDAVRAQKEAAEITKMAANALLNVASGQPLNAPVDRTQARGASFAP